jgi:arylsulfatase A-like enzyme
VDAPNLEAFAGQSVVFENAFCNSPACTPSRACAMTGRYAHTTGCVGLSHMGWPLDLSERTIVDYLNEAGYETVLSGVNHERHPRTDRYEVDVTETWEDWHTERAVGNAVAHLERRDRDRPFYLNVGSQQPHASTWSHADDMYGGAIPPGDVWVPPYCPDTPLLRRLLGRFQAAIRYMDEHFGRLMAALDELSYSENTIVVFTTDHGISARRSKGTLYDRGVEITLMVRLPDCTGAGTRRGHLVQNIDFAPTLLEAAGRSVPDEVQGRSFWPLLTGGSYEPHDAVFIERNFHGERPHRGADTYIDRYDPIRAVRTPDFHYIRWFRPEVKPRPLLPFELPAHWEEQSERLDSAWPESEEPRNDEELYHVRHDPQEFVNVVDRPEYRHVRADLRRRLEQWMKATDDFALRGEKPERPEEPGWGPNWPLHN